LAIEPCQRALALKPMTGTRAVAACNDFMDFVQALALQVETLKALPEKVEALEARIAELEAVPRSGSRSPSSDLLGTWERPSPDKQQPQQQQVQQHHIQPTDLLGIETPPPADPKPLLRRTPSPVPQQQQQQPQQDKSPLGVAKQAQQCGSLEDPLTLADPWASKSVPPSTALQLKPPSPVAPGSRLQVKPPPMGANMTSAPVGASGLLVKPPPFAIKKALEAAGEVAPGVSVDEATKATPPVKASQGPICEVAVEQQLPCKAPPKQLLLKAEQPPFKPPPLAEVVSEVATAVSEVPAKALPTKLIIKAPPPQFAR